ncbi:MAG: flagellar basal body P-ring formation chaperone FlgA [Amaricoccus sp.]|uniref:flagellar basal body P-ring formation chaperone FlgA n=1 Tax=Amaricoccus sp. TaxID=1872485 RepID=UPI0039E3CE7B
MARATALFLLFVALLSAGAVFAETLEEITRRAAVADAADAPPPAPVPAPPPAPALADLEPEGQSVTVVRALRSQSVIEADDLAVTPGGTPGGIDSVEAAVGMEAKVALYPGRPILASQIGTPALVERNALVKISYMKGPLSIITEGRALDRAAVGEAVRVMNLQSKQTVTGTVTPDGSVEVGQ